MRVGPDRGRGMQGLAVRVAHQSKSAREDAAIGQRRQQLAAMGDPRLQAPQLLPAVVSSSLAAGVLAIFDGVRDGSTTDDERLTALFQDVVARARVFQGGGAEATTSTLRDAVETAANRSLRISANVPAAPT